MSDELRLTDRELDAMSILWLRGSGTVAEVREAFPDDVAYTTVLWLLQTMEEKGYVYHEKEGRAYRYFPAVEQDVARESALCRIVEKVFHGSAEMLLTQLVSGRSLPTDELERMRNLLNCRLSDEEGR